MGINLRIKILQITLIVVAERCLRITSNKRLTAISQKHHNNILGLTTITQRYIKTTFAF